MTETATSGLRRCIGSVKFGIEPHDAPVADFPAQPSQKDGLGRMCKPHWRQYTNSLRKAALARKAAGEEPGEAKPTRAKAVTKRERRKTPMAHVPVDDVAEHAHSESAAAIRANRAERKALVEEAISEVLAD
jgi:hypothetical protein